MGFRLENDGIAWCGLQNNAGIAGEGDLLAMSYPP